MSTTQPISPQLVSILSQYQNLSLQLLTCLSTLSSSTSTTTSSSGSFTESSLYSQLSTLSTSLASLLHLVQLHSKQTKTIKSLLDQLHRYDSNWIDSIQRLKSIQDELDQMVQSGQIDKERIALVSASSTQTKTTRSGSEQRMQDDPSTLLTPSIILSYARRLAPFTSAPPLNSFSNHAHDPPPGSNKEHSLQSPTSREAELAQLLQVAASSESAGGTTAAGGGTGVFPPFPTEQAMRRGRLQFDTVHDPYKTKQLDGQELVRDQAHAMASVGVVGEIVEVGKSATGARRDASGTANISGTGAGAGAGAISSSQKLKNQAELEKKKRQQLQQEEDDFAFDLDLNPDL